MAVAVRHLISALAAATLGILGGLSFFTPLSYCQQLGDDWYVLAFYHGRARLFWLDVTRVPIITQAHEFQPTIKIRPVRPTGPPLPPRLAGPDTIRARAFWDRQITLGTWRGVSAFGGNWRTELRIPRPLFGAALATGVYMSYVRIPAWLPAIGLLIGPVRGAAGAIVRRRRARRGQCLACGYDLTGLPSPRCPECGTSFAE